MSSSTLLILFSFRVLITLSGNLLLARAAIIDRSRKKRVAGSPDSARSEHGAGEATLPSGRAKSAKGHSNQSPAVNDSGTPEESATTLGRGRRARKEKEQSMDVDGASRWPAFLFYPSIL